MVPAVIMGNVRCWDKKTDKPGELIRPRENTEHSKKFFMENRYYPHFPDHSMTMWSYCERKGTLAVQLKRNACRNNITGKLLCTIWHKMLSVFETPEAGHFYNDC